METPEQSMKFDVVMVSFVNFEQIWNIVLEFALLTFTKQTPAGKI